MTHAEVIDAVYGAEKWREMPTGERSAVERVLNYLLGVPAQEPTRDDLMMIRLNQACMEVWQMPITEVLKRTRKREYVEMRYIVFSVAREISRATPSRFAHLFPYDRNTINRYAIQVVTDWMQTDPDFRLKYLHFKAVATEYCRDLKDTDQ